MDERLPGKRVSDRERQAAVDRLRVAHDEGRLDLLEYDDRVNAAYRAVTYADLDALFTDLPAPDGSALPPVSAAGHRATGRPGAATLPTVLRVLWVNWLAVVAISLTVWVLVSVGNGEPDYFWPAWLLVPGAALFGVSAGVLGFRGRGPDRPR
jgi:hypothetical protein